MKPFDATNSKHKRLYATFKKELLSNTESNFHPSGIYKGAIDDLDLLFRDIADQEFDFDAAIVEDTGHWEASILNDDPLQYTVVIALEYTSEDGTECKEYLKGEGELKVSNDLAEVFLEICPWALDYSSEKEFKRGEYLGNKIVSPSSRTGIGS